MAQFFPRALLVLGLLFVTPATGLADAAVAAPEQREASTLTGVSPRSAPSRPESGEKNAPQTAATLVAPRPKASSTTPGKPATILPTTKLPAGKEGIPSADVSKIQAWKDASKLSDRNPGSTALVGGGKSMAPVYGGNTTLVVHPIEYNELKKGMVVVYMSQKTGGRVAHSLLAKERGGWRAKGLNNENEDSELVTPDNLIGIVYISLVSEGDP